LYDGIGMLRNFDAAYADMTAFWRKRLAQVDINLPGDPLLANTMRSQVAYILINRNKHAIQPGTRCYRRTWIRDGSLTSSALLQWGYKQEVEQFIRWFAPYIFSNGKVPCVVDRRGADPVPENDSHGQFLYLVAEYYRFTGDKQLVEDMFPTMLKVAGYIDQLRKSRQTDEFKTDETRHLYGLMPESISHEGYSDKPAYSYWDDLFVGKGLDDIAWLAGEFFKPEAAQLKELANSFNIDLLNSIARAMAFHHMDVIPGAADFGDFDACSSTIGLDPTNVLYARMDAMQRSFDRYWKEFQDRRDGRIEWVGYTPYEWRVVGTFLRLGRPDVAHECAKWFMTHRRPAGWNQWAEGVHKDPLLPRFIGDCPHGWVGSDFLRSARSMFAFEQVVEPQFGPEMIVGAGIKPEWLKAGVKINGIHSPHGVLNVEAREEDGHLFYNFSGTLRISIRLQLPEGHKSITINGKQLPPEYTTGKSWTGIGWCFWMTPQEWRRLGGLEDVTAA
jgi:hypothetical protein